VVISSLFITLGLGAILGLLGQGIRTIIGLYKNQLAIDWNRLIISLGLGAIAGSLMSLSLTIDLNNIINAQVLALIASGYAGADFIEGFINRRT
jgi:hypothetical protein